MKKGALTLADLVLFGVLWLVFSILGEVGVNTWGHNFYYYTASTQAYEGLDASLFIFRFLVPIFVFVVLMLLFVPLRFRAKEGVSPPPGKRARTNRLYVGLWLAVSIGVNLLFFAHPTTSAAQQLFNEMAPANNHGDLIVDVTARQWQWQFGYPQYGITAAQNAEGNNVLYLPVGRKVEFVLRSYDYNHPYAMGLDVIHSFWVPAFGIKQDVIPGETRIEVVTPTIITSTEVNPMVRVQCAEVCGPGHPLMYASVHVVSDQAFLKWAKAEKKAGF